MVIVFDLDDTLYPEMEYVKSGFRAIASFVANSFGVDEEAFFRAELEWLKREGRGKVFDRALEQFHLVGRQNVAELIKVYRAHQPVIALYPEAREVLQALRQQGIATGVITDGCAMVQWAKVKALSLEALIDIVVVTDDWGSDYWKPHERAYRHIMDTFGEANEFWYIGDNPHKDFFTARKLGWKTVRVLYPGGAHADARLSKTHEADVTIVSLTDLMDCLV